jgi:hypothetical protein
LFHSEEAGASVHDGEDLLDCAEVGFECDFGSVVEGDFAVLGEGPDCLLECVESF